MLNRHSQGWRFNVFFDNGDDGPGTGEGVTSSVGNNTGGVTNTTNMGNVSNVTGNVGQGFGVTDMGSVNPGGTASGGSAGGQTTFQGHASNTSGSGAPSGPGYSTPSFIAAAQQAALNALFGGPAAAASLYGDPGSITGYMSPQQIRGINQQLQQGQSGTPAFGNVSTAALTSTPPSNSLAALAAQLMGNTLGGLAPGGLASLGSGGGATMGFPAVEGVSPGVTAAPAGPSPGTTGVASNAPSAAQAVAPSISPNAFAFADEGGAPQGANAATQAPSTVSSPTSSATQSPLGDMSGILQLVMNLMGDQGLGNLAQSALMG